MTISDTEGGVTMKVFTDGLDGFARRSLTRAKKLDRGARMPASVSITFDDPLDMLAVLTPQRVKLIGIIKLKPMSVSDLADRLKREARSVRRDVNKLEEVGVVKTHKATNPGHGSVRIVVPVAETISLTATI
jgi:predicted transcriptional regulator